MSGPAPLKSSFHGPASRVVAENYRPARALSGDPTRRRREMRDWRFAVLREVGGQARALRLAWLISELAGQRGYAFASDATLAKLTFSTVATVYLGLRTLERVGLIERATVEASPGRFARRIFVTAHPTFRWEGGTQRSVESADLRSVGTENLPDLRTHARTRGGSRDAARQAAENRERGFTFQTMIAEDEARGGRGRT